MSERVLITRAWRWSLEHSPLLNLVRWGGGMCRPQRGASSLIEASGLPEPLKAQIDKTVRRTRLWGDERAQVARELIAHSRDAMEAGRTAEEILASYGRWVVVARLLRRAMKRKRPAPWRALAWAQRAAMAAVGLTVLGYLVLAARFYAGSPDVSRDYVAQLNADILAYPSDQRAWPIYDQADRAWRPVRHELLSTQRQRRAEDPQLDAQGIDPGVLRLSTLTPEHPEYAEVARAVRALQPQLERVREASARAIVGAPLRNTDQEIRLTDEVSVWRPASEPEQGPSGRPLYTLLLMHLGVVRDQASLLAFDARLALDDGEAPRAQGDLLAIADLSRQMYAEPFLICDMVARAIQGLFCERVEALVTAFPGALSDAQLVELAHAQAMLLEHTTLDLAGEQFFFQDMLQRAYTDDGEGGGRLTPQGAEMFRRLSTITAGDELEELLLGDSELAKFSSPLLLMGAPDRRAERLRYERVMGVAREVLAQGPGHLPWLVLAEDRLEAQSQRLAANFSPTQHMIPALSRALQQHYRQRQRTQAVGVMLAIELARRERGALPASLDELGGRWLPQIPQDMFNPGHPIGYAVDGRGGYVLYSVGSDGDDDGGLAPDSKPREAAAFDLRYALATTSERGVPKVVRDEQGDAMRSPPRGPDGDWVLIDTRDRDR